MNLITNSKNINIKGEKLKSLFNEFRNFIIIV